jgi:hypothetical protein
LISVFVFCRFGDRLAGNEKRDSFIDSENETTTPHHRTIGGGGGNGDDSDAFADDEAPSSGDGFEVGVKRISPL